MTESEKTVVFAFLIALLIGLSVGFYTGESIANRQWRKWCIEWDYAHYDSKTGVFTLGEDQ